jgi:hypothetical protein
MESHWEVSDYVGGILLSQYMLSVHVRSHMAPKTVLQFNDNNNGEVIPVYAMKAYESIARHILNLNTRWRCVVSFMPQPLNLR